MNTSILQRFYILILLPTILSSTLRSQEPQEKKEVETTPYIQTPPEFPGGQKALICYIEKRLAKQLLEVSDSGSIILTATLDKTGNLKNVKLNLGDVAQVPERLKPLSNKSLEEEIRHVFENMPAWKPEMENDRPVQSEIFWPIKFPYQLKCEDP